MLDHEPPLPPPPLPPPFEPPTRAARIVATRNVAQHMATAKKKKKKQVTLDESLYVLLAEQDKKKAKAAKKAVARHSRPGGSRHSRPRRGDGNVVPRCRRGESGQEDNKSCQHRLGQEDAEDKDQVVSLRDGGATKYCPDTLNTAWRRTSPATSETVLLESFNFQPPGASANYVTPSGPRQDHRQVFN